jgi:hypothetical protein
MVTIPSIIQSAFILSNGQRIKVYTSNIGIVSYKCDDNWIEHKEPFAKCPPSMMGSGPVQYHISIRKLHSTIGSEFIAEQSTNLQTECQNHD